MRRRAPADSSLELLLDTICNTFGGVLFLAILVCILLRTAGGSSSAEAPPVREEDVLELQRRQLEVTSSLERLRSAAAQQVRLASQFQMPETKPMVTELLKRHAERDSLADEQRRLLADLAARQAKVAAIEQQLLEFQRQMSQAKAEVAHVEAGLHADVDAKSVDAPLPRERHSRKREVGFVLRNGRLYQWIRYDADGAPSGLNTEEFVVVADKAAGTETLPKPHKGIVIKAPTAAPQIEAAFRRFDTGTIHLTLVVWADSFEEFQTVKSIAVKLGFEYRIIAMGEGSVLSNRGGGDGRVQ